MNTLLLLSSLILMTAAFAALAGVMEVWGSRFRFRLPGGLRAAMLDGASYRGASNLLVIAEHEHYAAVTVRRWGLIVWHTVPNPLVYATHPDRAFTIVPRGTAAYQLARTIVNRAPVAAQAREPSYDDGY